MDIGQITATLIQQAKETSLLEWVAIFFAVAEVLLARYNKVLLYPAGIISTALYTYLFVQPSAKLYADAMLNSYYFIMSIYGWLLWTRGGSKKHIEITPNNNTDWAVSVSIAVIGWGVLYLLLTKGFPTIFSWYTPSDIAWLDAFISATAWAGMWLLAKRKIENWLFLNISNAIAVPVYIYKGMPLTAALTIFLFIVACLGYFAWKKEYRLKLKMA